MAQMQQRGKKTRFERLEALYHDLVELGGEARAERLAAVRREDPGLVATLIRLLAVDEDDVTEEAQARPLASLELPAQIGPYRLVRRIAEGGMGEVFEAEQIEPVARRVAVKLVRYGASAPAVLARFELERQMLAQMRHPGIAQVHDAGVAPDGRPYVVMELVPGQPITSFCDERQLGTRTRLELFLQVCAAVQHAHQKGVIHRDLKPSNILVSDTDGSPRAHVIDFGIAKAVRDGEGGEGAVTRLGEIIGTLEYMSPEQAAGSDAVDTRSDVYALGAVVYELLVGVVPQPTGDTPLPEAVRRIRETPTPRPSRRLTTESTSEEVARRRRTDVRSLGRQLRGDLDWVAMKALAKEPERRYEAVAELSRDVQRFLEGRTVSARPESVRYRVHSFVRRHTAAVVASSVAVLALVVATVVSTGLYVQAEGALVEAERQREAAEQVSRFLQGMLEEADPQRAQQHDAITVREALDQAASKLDHDLSGQPEVAAALHRTIARAYESLATFEPAEEHYRSALRLYERLGEDAVEEAVESAVDLATLYLTQNKVDAATPLLQRSTGLVTRLPEPMSLLWSARIALAQGRVDELGGRMEAAEERMRAAVSGFERLRHLEEEAGARSTLGVLLSNRGRHRQAAEELRRALEIWREEKGETHSDVAEAMNDLAWVLMVAGEHEEALGLFERALGILEQVYGPNHPEVAVAAANLGNAYRQQERYEDSVRLLERALTSFEARLGSDHPHVGHTRNNLAFTYQESDRLKEAESEYRKAIAIYEAAVGPEHVWTAAGRYNLAHLLHLSGRLEAAEAESREVLQLRRRVLRPDHPDIARSLHQLGQLRMESGDLAAAKPLLDQALSIRRRELPDGHPQIESAQRDLERCLEQLGS